MPHMSRRLFLTSAAAAASLRAAPQAAITLAKSPPARRVLELVYDKSMGMMRAVERVVH